MAAESLGLPVVLSMPRKKIMDFSEGNLENLAGILLLFFLNKQIEQTFEDLILLRTHSQRAEMGARELLG